jgi:hypothetical protein
MQFKITKRNGERGFHKLERRLGRAILKDKKHKETVTKNKGKATPIGRLGNGSRVHWLYETETHRQRRNRLRREKYKTA